MLGPARESALHTAGHFRDRLSREMGGEMRFHALMSLQAHVDSLDPAERFPEGTERLPPHEEARVAHDGAWYATLCNASYGSRGAMWFSAWSVAAKAGAGAEVGAVAGAAAGVALTSDAGGVADAAAAGAVAGAVDPSAARGPDSAEAGRSSDDEDDAGSERGAVGPGMAGAVGHLAERASHAWSMLGAAALRGDVGAFTHLTGLHPADVLFARLRARPHLPAHFLVRDDSRRELVLVLRGTISEADVMTDITAHEAPFLSGTGHEAMVRSAYELYMSLLDEGPEGVGLRRHLREHDGYRFVITGHSLGGGVASLLHVLMHQQSSNRATQRLRTAQLRGAPGRPKDEGEDDDSVPLPSACWSFGAPPVVAPLSAVSDAAAASLTQVVVGDDVVPRLSVWSLVRLARLLRHLDELYPARSMAQAVGVAAVKRPPLGVAVQRARALAAADEDAAGAGPGGADEDTEGPDAGGDAAAGAGAGKAHSGASKEAEDDGPAAGDADEGGDRSSGSRLWLPGRIFVVGSPGTEEGRHVREARAEAFAEVSVSSRSVLDHLPTTYVSSLRAVAEAAGGAGKAE